MPPEQTVVATPSIESVPEKTGSQENVLPSQEDKQTQDIETPQVETAPQLPSRQETGRPRPSDFYKIRQLEKTIRQMEDRFNKILEEKNKTPVSITPDTKTLSEQEMSDLFYSNPVKWALERETQLKQDFKSEIEKFRNEVPEIISAQDKEKEYGRNSQEALELIFPKSSSNLSLQKRIEQDPERAETIMRILEETGLEAASKTNPISAAKTVLKLYDLEQKEKQSQRSPNAPTKGQMASTITAMPQGGGRKMPTVQELQVELQNMNQKLSENPDLLLDKNFKNRWDLMKLELEKISV